MVMTGSSCPLTVGGEVTEVDWAVQTQVPVEQSLLRVGAEPWAKKLLPWANCWTMSTCSERPPTDAYSPLSQSSNGPAMRIAPAMPFVTWSAVEPCLWG